MPDDRRAAPRAADVLPHGTYHLTLGPVTLRLTEDELAFVARAIAAMAGSRPSLLAKIAVDEGGAGGVPPPGAA